MDLLRERFLAVMLGVAIGGSIGLAILVGLLIKYHGNC